MKHVFISFILLVVVMSCKSSYNKVELHEENMRLKERIKMLKAVDSIHSEAALELENMNVVYRGVSNPIYISKPNVLSFEASAPGLQKNDNNGHYTLSPRTGRTVDIIITSRLKNGDSLTEIKTLRIKDIDIIQSTINKRGCNINKCELTLNKKELKGGEIGLDTNSFLFDLDMNVKGFKLKLPNQAPIHVFGNIIPDEVNHNIDLLHENDEVFIFDIKLKINNPKFYSLRVCKISPIKIRVVD